MFHRAQLSQRVKIEIAAVDETTQLIEELAAEPERPGDRPGAQQRSAFPRLPVVLIEAQRTIEGHHQRRIAPTRPQAQIDAKASGGEQLGDDLADARGGDTALTGRRRLKNINQVEVGTQVEFAGAELAHRKYAEIAGLAREVANEAMRGVARRPNAFIGEARHQQHGELHIDLAGEVGNRNAVKNASLEAR